MAGGTGAEKEKQREGSLSERLSLKGTLPQLTFSKNRAGKDRATQHAEERWRITGCQPLSVVSLQEAHLRRKMLIPRRETRHSPSHMFLIHAQGKNGWLVKHETSKTNKNVSPCQKRVQLWKTTWVCLLSQRGHLVPLQSFSQFVHLSRALAVSLSPNQPPDPQILLVSWGSEFRSSESFEPTISASQNNNLSSL